MFGIWYEEVPGYLKIQVPFGGSEDKQTGEGEEYGKLGSPGFSHAHYRPQKVGATAPGCGWGQCLQARPMVPPAL